MGKKGGLEKKVLKEEDRLRVPFLIVGGGKLNGTKHDMVYLGEKNGKHRFKFDNKKTYKKKEDRYPTKYIKLEDLYKEDDEDF